MAEEQWQWQEEGTSWRGVGIYHITLTIPSRVPLLGSLVVPDGNPANAWVERTELGRLLLDCQRSVPMYHPEIQILQYCLMPDHLHTIWFVRRPMKQSIRQVAQGFWQATKKLGRAHSYISALTGIPTNESPLPASLSSIAAAASPAASPAGSLPASLSSIAAAASPAASPAGSLPSLSPIAAAASLAASPAGSLPSLSSIAAAASRENPLCQALGREAYSLLPPVFGEKPFIRPLSRRGQLQAMIRYVQMNPQRLATKRLMPGFFRVQQGIVIGGHTYSGVGNIKLLAGQSFATVHVRSIWVKAAEHGDRQPLRDYMNGCVLKARKGAVMVSPFISQQEKQVMQVLLNEQHPFILLADNGFRDYYKPSDAIFDACAAGRVLILSPWPYDAGKRHISRSECIALNEMAEEIVSAL